MRRTLLLRALNGAYRNALRPSWIRFQVAAAQPALAQHAKLRGALQGESLWQDAWRRLKKNKMAMGGLVVTILMSISAALAGQISPFDPATQQRGTGALSPRVEFNASLSHDEESNSGGSETQRAQILAEVTIPLYQQGAVSSRVRQAKQISNQRRIEIEEARRRSGQESTSAWEALQTARAQIRSFESGVRSAEIALEGVRQENEVGARTILDILDAEQELLDAQVNLVRSQRDEIVAGFAVLAAIGQLIARDLELAVEVYNPEVDYLNVRNAWFGLGINGKD